MSLSTQWHQWFAWHPVWIGSAWAWLRTVERRDHIEHGEYWWTEYRGTPQGGSNG